jgi:hypothetical protein
MAQKAKSSKKGRDKVKCKRYSDRERREFNKAGRVVRYILGKPGHAGKEMKIALHIIGEDKNKNPGALKKFVLRKLAQHNIS